MEPGRCDRSFGIHVARIANFPVHVVSEAENIAAALERGEAVSNHLVTASHRDSAHHASEEEDRDNVETNALQATQNSSLESPAQCSSSDGNRFMNGAVRMAGGSVHSYERSCSHKRRNTGDEEDGGDALDNPAAKRAR